MTAQVFERNVERLIARAYVPALPRESFRAELARDFVARAGRFSEAEPAAPLAPRVPRVPRVYGAPRSRRLRWVGALTAAAAVLALLFGLWPRDDVRTESLESLLARGEVAGRVEPDGDWNAADRPLAFAGGFLELATPVGQRASIDTPAAAFELEAASRIVLRGGVAAERTELSAGGVAIERAGAGTLLISTSEGELALRAGELRVAYEPPPDPRAGPFAEQGPWVRLIVRDGEASVHVRGHAREGARVLGGGSEAFLQGGELLVRGDPPPEPVATAAADRTRVEPASESDPVPELEAEEPPAQVSGRVLAGEPPLPVTRFQVVLLAEKSLPQVAEPVAFPFESADGRFELRGLVPRRYSVSIRADGYALWRGEQVEVEAPGAGISNELHATLRPGVSVRGIVVDADTGLPIVDALVVSETDAPMQILSVALAEEPHDLLTMARTGPDGGFELEGLTPGQQVLRASAPGRAPSWTEPFHLPAERPLEHDVELELELGATLFGVATDEGGQPIADAYIVCSLTDFSASHPVMTYGSAPTDAEGRYEIPNMPEGNWPVVYFRSLVEENAIDPELGFVQLFAGERVRRDFRVSVGLALSGVLLGSDGEPLVGRSLWLQPTGQGATSLISTSTGARGEYSFVGLDPIQYYVSVSGLTLPDMFVLGTVDLSGGVDVEQHDFRLPDGTVRGRVLDGVSSEPLAFAVVVLLRTDDPSDQHGYRGKTLSGEDGFFEFAGVEAGSYQVLVFSSEGSYGQEVLRNLRLEPDEQLETGDVHLYPGGALSVSVLDPEGEPLAGAEVRTRFEDGLVYRLNEYPITQSDGRFQVAGVTPGRWTVTISATGMRTEVREAVVRVVDEPVVLEVRMERE